ncbi:hypothetical protein CIG2463D_1368 [Campylobacter iguaniorum]|uniref:SU10 major capsid protein n=1 Tax=Campylobacter iguaniorum TaxID=1244531 RepID=UPI00073A29FF|nr:DUF5309 family protein [Campylobacter iguaniorum]ALV24936.1 hypothetical protein CIG2463D_1368 [Campylobacter iguaniorum]
MPFLKDGLISSAEAFGKIADYESAILSVGRKDTPFLSSISQGAPISRSGKVEGGHRWFYDSMPEGSDTNAHVEGGAMAALKTYTGEELTNHYQIVKETFGVSGTEEEATRLNNQTVLASQRQMATVNLTKSIEKILLGSTAPVKRVNTAGAQVAGKCGGLKSFATAENKIDAQGATLSWKLVREVLKLGYMKGGSQYKIIMMNATQKDALDDILFSKANMNGLGTSRIDNDVTVIGNTPYGSNINVLLSPYLADTEIIAYNPDDIYKVNWRAMRERQLNTSDDAVLYEILNEFTLRVCTPFAFAWIHNLGE